MCGISRRRREQFFQDFGREHQRVAAGKQHIPHLRRALEILDLHLEFLAVEGLPGVADDARACAVTAIGRALGRDQHEHPVRVAVDQPGHGGVAVFRQGVFHHRGEGLHLLRERE